MSIMGIGTSILGYSNPEVDLAVKKRLSGKHVDFKLFGGSKFIQN